MNSQPQQNDFSQSFRSKSNELIDRAEDNLQELGRKTRSKVRKLSREIPKTISDKSEKFGDNLKSFVGLSETQEAVENTLDRLLADTSALQVKTRNFIWNTTDADREELLTLLEAHRGELLAAMDEIAGQIRVEGRHVPATFEELESLTRLDSHKVVPLDKKMIEALIQAHKKVESTALTALTLAKQTHDTEVEKIASERVKCHQHMVAELGNWKD